MQSQNEREQQVVIFDYEIKCSIPQFDREAVPRIVSNRRFIKRAHLKVLLKTVPSECAAHRTVKDVLDLTYVHLPIQELRVPVLIRVGPEQLLLIFRKLYEALLL